MKMTIRELRTLLADLPPGTEVGIANEVYAILFPPGKPNMNAQVHCSQFAEVHGCTVKDSPDGNEVVFVKDAAG